MGKDKDFSVLVKYGRELYCFSCVVYSRLKSIREKNGKIKFTEKLAVLQYPVLTLR